MAILLQKSVVMDEMGPPSGRSSSAQRRCAHWSSLLWKGLLRALATQPKVLATGWLPVETLGSA